MSDLLRPEDSAFLNDHGHEYEALVEGGMICLTIHNYQLPAGYQPAGVDLLLRLPLNFPDAAPDMFWTNPVVFYTNGGIPPATEARQQFLGREWQRWSRHFNQQSAWRPGTDDLRSFMTLIYRVLKREVVPVAA